MVCDKFEKCIIASESDGSARCLQCRCENSDSNISCHENGKRYNLCNDMNLFITNFLIDGGVYEHKDKSSRCDRLYVVSEAKKTAIFIELKGKNCHHALEQLYNTADRHRKLLVGMRVRFRIICSGAPNMGNDPKSIKLKRIISMEYGVLPLIKEKNYTEFYSKIL